MHTFTGPEGTTFRYNSDFSGDVIILRSEGETLRRIEVPGTDLLILVGNLVRSLRISELEQQTAHEVLFGKTPPAWAPRSSEG